MNSFKTGSMRHPKTLREMETLRYFLCERMCSNYSEGIKYSR